MQAEKNPSIYSLRVNRGYTKYEKNPQGIAIISFTPLEYINNQYKSTASRSYTAILNRFAAKETYETKQHLQFCHENNNLAFSPSHVVLSKHRSVVMDVPGEIQSKIIKLKLY